MARAGHRVQDLRDGNGREAHEDLRREQTADVNDNEATIDHVKNFRGIVDLVCLANLLDASLTFHTTGEAQKVTNLDDWSTEAWRRLIRRWGLPNAHSGLSLMTQILSPQPVKKLIELLRTMENWEAMVRKQDRKTNATTITDTTEIALIINMYPADLARHLRTNSNMYKIIRSDEVGSTRVRRPCDPKKEKLPQSAHDDPLDIGACHGNPQ